MSDTARDDGAIPTESVAVDISSLKAFASQLEKFPALYNRHDKLAEPTERIGRAPQLGAAVVLGDRNTECLAITEGLVEQADKRWRNLAKAVRELADGYASDDAYSAATVRDVHNEFDNLYRHNAI